MKPESNDQQEMQKFLLDNKRLLAENNELLKKLNRNAKISLWLKVIWFLFIIGLPFVLYFYVLQPYFDALGSSFATFQAGLQEIPGWKQFYETVRGVAESGKE